MTHIRRLVILAAALPMVAFPTLLLATTGSPDPAALDRSLEMTITRRLNRHGFPEHGDVVIRSEAGVVTLQGTVDSLCARNEAVRLAARGEEVSEVIDQLELLPAGDPQTIAAGIQRAVDQTMAFDIFDWIEAHLDHGRVTLDGSVFQPWRRETVEARIARVPGVTAIDNRIRVQPVSANDDRIRFEAARSIYRDLLFTDLRDTLSPPVHIVVEDGHVTLEGVVRSRVEQQVAAAIVRQDTLSFGVTNHLRVASEIPR